MSLPNQVAIKLDLYTLACHELASRLPTLRTATQSDTRCDYETCISLFDDVISRFFDRYPAHDRQQSADHLGNMLRVEADNFRSASPAASSIFDDVAEAVSNNIAAWAYRTELERLHDLGRNLAKRFYRASIWSETHTRLGRECTLVVGHGEPDDDERLKTRDRSFGYRAAPAAFYENYRVDESGEWLSNVVLMRFTFQHDFALYLAFPFLFLHEYTAHIYATDHGNEPFNDGWMLHAAASFLSRHWNRSHESLDLNWAQIGAFYRHLYGRINPIPRNKCEFAQQFDAWLSDNTTPLSFVSITHELAAFEPTAAEPFFWPTQFINALELWFLQDRRLLLDKIQSAANVRELRSLLTGA